MNKYLIILFLFLSSIVFAADSQEALLRNYTHIYKLSDYGGNTYLSFMKNVVRPAMINLVEHGYKVADSRSIKQAYKIVDTKVQRVVDQNGGLEHVMEIADHLEGQIVTLTSLPLEIAKVDKKVNRYNLATFLGLVSGGGVTIQYDENNYSYNVHYDKSEQKSGRSFGASPNRLASDASDKAYLQDVQEYTNEIINMPSFYKTLLETLLNSDPQNYRKVSPLGQTVLTDFLAVYTAEQARNLMDGHINIHWDAALLEVTLLASFHAGQEEFKLFYQNPQTGETSFTNTVYRQTPCAIPTGKRQANMTDYWQFSRRIKDPKNCKRSGINITNREFRKLEREITKFIFKNHRDLHNAVIESMNIEKSDNLYLSLSEFLLNDGENALQVTNSSEVVNAWIRYLKQVTQEASRISSGL